jgi:uncharacterized circularly permuted ATP-grasp superfamily protein/uncharacterized alpha-E superfamily protein
MGPLVQSQSQSFGGPTRPVAGSTGQAAPYLVGDGYDEIHSPDQNLRPHYQSFFQSIPDLAGEEFAGRWRDAEYLIRENGVTYNVYGDPKGWSRPWQLDPMPVLVPPSETEHLQSGLIQRAELLGRLFADIYGEQRCLHDGLIPPELVFANPGFLRPCHGLNRPGQRSLHLYGANLGRGTDGRWYLIGDRTQAPSGAGYALENRIVVSRTLPEAFRLCRVQRIARFFQSLLDTLRQIAPRNSSNPRIVLLTPGPLNETYFEHSYLARYLGCTLVEGGDLTVRDDRVYLKVLGGLQPVDVILRRLDDDFCDPLELRPDSFLGVPGLVQAVRMGNVAVANALGASVLETPAFKAFLPRLAQAWFGKDLILKSPQTWWCGDATQREHVFANLNTLVIKPSFTSSSIQPVYPDRLDTTARSELIARIRARPHLYVGQERLTLSTCPVFENGQLVPRKMILRTYLAASESGFVAMPGGLTRVAASGDELSISMQRGGGSKDTWFLSAGPVSTFSRLPASDAPVLLNRGGGELPSRVADNLFWLGRYAERAEGLCRMLRGVMGRLADRTDGLELPALLRSIGSAYGVGVGESPESAVASLFDAERELFSLLFDPRRDNSVADIANKLHRVAGIVRDRISTDMWRVVNGIRFPSPNTQAVERFRSDRLTTGDALDVLDRTIVQLAAFGGLATESMTRADGWRFLDLGRKLERALHMVSLVRGTLVYPAEPEPPVLDAVLDIADSRITYRRRYLGALRVEAVLDLLLFDESNPRALISQLQAFADDVEHLPRQERGVGRSVEQRLAVAVTMRLELTDVHELGRVEDGTRPALAQLMNELNTLLPELSEVLTQQYLSHLQTTRHLAPFGGES